MRILKNNKHGQSLWNRLLTLHSKSKRGERFSADERDDSEDEAERGDELLCCALGHASLHEETRTGNDTSNNTPASTAPEKQSTDMLMRDRLDAIWANYIDTDELRLFVGTWNVAGKPPPDDLDLQDWLGTKEPADIYVIGFQEIVPLNPGNVLGNDDGISASKWDALIRGTLNNTPRLSKLGRRRSSSAPSSPWHDNPSRVWPPDTEPFDGETGYFLAADHNPVRRVSPAASARVSFESRPMKIRPPYVRIASKQMVGVFISVWIRREQRRHVKDVQVSCVGCGIMGCLGNKGSISVSLSLHQTNFCFVCSHLTSGEKEAAGLRRNSDVTEILRRTQFPRSKKLAEMDLPETILAHDRIIWFGDLNYRLSLPGNEMKALVVKEDWETLLEKDQLKLEQSAGRVFEGWREGSISFAPTYKYMNDSDLYSGMHAKEGEKRRAPAWCDRILWYGKGLKQLSYIRSESRLSDHRPVKSLFKAEVEIISQRKLRKIPPFTMTKVEVEEVLPMNKLGKLGNIDFSSEEIYKVRTVGGGNTTLKIRKLTLLPMLSDGGLQNKHLGSLRKAEDQKD